MNDNQDQPIQIDAATLEVRDKEKMATFAGDVQVVQGDTTIKCQKLVVFYGPEPGARPMRPRPSGSTTTAAARPQRSSRSRQAAMPTRKQDIRRIEARGGVTVLTKDQKASGDLGVYDLKTKTITLLHNVTVARARTYCMASGSWSTRSPATPISIPMRRRKMERHRQGRPVVSVR